MRTRKRREHLLRIPLTKGEGSEFEAVERAAEKSRIPATTWARAVILREAEKVNEGWEG